LGLLKKASENTIMPMIRRSKMSCDSGWRGGTETFTRQEYMLMFKGGNRLDKNGDRILQ